ncbi:hypothetical protein D5071_20865 [Pectobacterium carotovorum]|uniref:Uncharacterized protein n=1 Tax=Pectobacterium carotovorum TaxID=554 RepID=A0A419AQE6_PECCA|nr:hypothetical protein D5071_20865 [Pectobacterium carotovorum]
MAEGADVGVASGDEIIGAGSYFFLFISVILQAACALASLKYSARRGPRPKGPLQAAFKSAPSRFVTPVTYSSKLLEIHAVAACLQLELFRIYIGR